MWNMNQVERIEYKRDYISPHVHIDRDALSAKFWIQPVALAYNLGFPARELRTLETMTLEHQKELLEAWNEYFGA